MRWQSIWRDLCFVLSDKLLGKAFNLSAVAIGKKLKELELRQADGTPTANAISEGYCRAAPLKDGTPFFLWHKRRVKHLLQANGLRSQGKICDSDARWGTLVDVGLMNVAMLAAAECISVFINEKCSIYAE
jgi:hypothetical protein